MEGIRSLIYKQALYRGSSTLIGFWKCKTEKKTKTKNRKKKKKKKKKKKN